MIYYTRGQLNFCRWLKRWWRNSWLGAEVLSSAKSLTFNELEIQKGPNNCSISPQETYESELPIMDITSYVIHHVLKNAPEIKSTFRQRIGSLIWILHARPDVGFRITKLATDTIQACSEVAKAQNWRNLYNKTVRSPKNAIRAKFTIGRARNHRAGESPNSRLQGYRIVSFTDAGSAPLEGERSIESGAIISGRMLFRDATIRCHGYLMGQRCAKIQRVCRSSLSDECHAAVHAGDYSLRYQITMNGIFTHVRQIRQLCPPAEYPTLCPFTKSPSGESLKADKLICSESEKQWAPAEKLADEPVIWNYEKCESCLISIPVCTFGRNYPTSCVSPKNDSPLFKP